MNSHAAGTSNGGSGDAAAGGAARRNTRMPKYSKFTQQELPACKPILTPKWVVSVFFIVGVIFVPIGVVSLLAARDVVEIIDRYDEACVPGNMTDNKLAYIQNETISKECIRNLTVTKFMKQPIFVYYELDNFYQNHRRYVKSRNDAQLRDASKANQTSACEPEKTTANGQPIVPCGLIAWSLFNDTYNFSRGNENLTVDKKDISWKSDREHKFGKDVYPSNFQNGALKGGATLNPKIPLSEQEDLIVWMRTAALPTFRKLYGRIYFDLKENDTITVRLNNNYNTYSFGGKKKLVLSTATWLGGKNDFLGFAYLIVGGLCIFLAFAFTLLYFVKPRLVTFDSLLQSLGNYLCAGFSLRTCYIYAYAIHCDSHTGRDWFTSEPNLARTILARPYSARVDRVMQVQQGVVCLPVRAHAGWGSCVIGSLVELATFILSVSLPTLVGPHAGAHARSFGPGSAAMQDFCVPAAPGSGLSFASVEPGWTAATGNQTSEKGKDAACAEPGLGCCTLPIMPTVNVMLALK